MQQVQDLHYIRVNKVEDDFEEIRYNRNHVHIILIHCISDDTFKMKNIIELPEDYLNDEQFRTIYTDPDNQELMNIIENDIKAKFDIAGPLRFPKENEHLPEKFNGYYMHRLMVCPICSIFALEFLREIEYILFAYDQIKIKALKETIQEIRNTAMPPNIQNTHFYMLAFGKDFKVENQNPNSFVRLHKYNAEMHEHPERYDHKKVFFRVDNITSNILFHNKELIPFLDTKFSSNDFMHKDRYIDIRFSLLPQLKKYLIQFFEDLKLKNK